ncbi:MAG: insulinase family protein [Saccharospirillaceae bacterium]|nr:insulinase family protein [Saccharospirillaceae bacterium]
MKILISLILIILTQQSYAITINSSEFDHKILENGMQVIFKSTEVVTGSIDIHWNVEAGAANELSDTDGVAHLTEHSLFSVSDYPDLFKQVELWGGSVQAYTYYNLTSYRFNVPEAHAGYVFDVLAKWQNIKKFNKAEHQKNIDIVKNEIKWRNFTEQTYPDAHFLPSNYSRSVVGIHESIKEVTIKEVKDYYKAWYQPKNTSLLIYGTVNNKEKLNNLIEQKLNTKWKKEKKRIKKLKIVNVENKQLEFKTNFYKIQQSDSQYDELLLTYYQTPSDLNKALFYSSVLGEFVNKKIVELIKGSDYILDYSDYSSIMTQDLMQFEYKFYIKKGYARAVLKYLDESLFDVLSGDFTNYQFKQNAESVYIPSEIYLNEQWLNDFYQALKNKTEFNSIADTAYDWTQLENNYNKNDFLMNSFDLLNDHFFGVVKTQLKKGEKDNQIIEDMTQYLEDYAADDLLIDIIEEKQIAIVKPQPIAIKKPTIQPSKKLKRAVYTWQLENGIEVVFIPNFNIDDGDENVSVTYTVDDVKDGFDSVSRVSGHVQINATFTQKFNFIEKSYADIPNYQSSTNIEYKVRDYWVNDVGVDLYSRLMSPYDSHTVKNLVSSLKFQNFKQQKNEYYCQPSTKVNEYTFEGDNLYVSDCLDTEMFDLVTAENLDAIRLDLTNRNFKPKLRIVGSLTLPEATKWIEQYIATISTHNKKVASNNEKISHVKLNNSGDFNIGQHAGKGSVVNIYYVNQMQMNLKQRQMHSIITQLIKNELFHEIREKRAQAYAVGSSETFKNENSMANYLTFWFSSSIESEQSLYDLTHEVLDEFNHSLIDKVEFERAKHTIVTSIAEFDLTSYINAFHKLSQNYNVSFNEGLSLKSITQAITIKDIETYRNIILENSSLFVFFQDGNNKH